MRYQVFHVTGFHLLACHNLLDGRDAQNDSQHSRQRAMIP
jgi:hypothetical protein